jgi:hypothetical protein
MISTLPLTDFMLDTFASISSNVEIWEEITRGATELHLLDAHPTAYFRKRKEVGLRYFGSVYLGKY